MLAHFSHTAAPPYPGGVTHPDNEYSSIFCGALVAQYGGLSSQQGSTSTYGVGYPQLMIDEQGKQKQGWLDGFGRTIEVDEALTAGTTSHGSFSICCTGSVNDQGTVYVTVGTFDTQVSYNNSSTANSVASALARLASALNGSDLVTASASGSRVPEATESAIEGLYGPNSSTQRAATGMAIHTMCFRYFMGTFSRELESTVRDPQNELSHSLPWKT